MKSQLRGRAAWLQWWPWAVALVGSLLLVLVTARLLVDRELARHGEEEAENWLAFVDAAVPEVGAALKGHDLSAHAREALVRLGHFDEVFRFRLFDAQGALVLDSRQLEDRYAAIEPPDAATVQTVIRVAREGEEHTDIAHGADNLPAHYAVAFMPLREIGRVSGVFVVYLDQAERGQALEQAFTLICALVTLLTCALAGTAAFRIWQQMRDKLNTEERVRYLASHDALSGTLNRNSFTDVLEAAKWRRQGGGSNFSVLCIDLDRFKDVNDGHGHAAGDEVLRMVGERLRSVLRHGDAVARLGGDEFAVMQSGVQSPQDTARLAERIVNVLSEPFEVAGMPLRCGGSVGAAVFEAGSEVQSLLKQADAALYQAKAQGRGCFAFYDAGVDAAVRQRRQLAFDLRGALQARQLRLEYQALYCDGGKRLRGYEALMRWSHPTQGAVSPAVFIPLAEECGLIGEIGAWALHAACAEAARWPEDLMIAVNLSPAQFERGDLVDTVRHALQEAGLSARRLELEITESLLINNTQQVLQALHRLSDMGVRIAMDDFGTGYSSLAYLWRFPFDKIKIDRAFVKDIAGDPKVELIVKSIIDLAHAMRISVTGEGVETDAQLQTLRRHGCDEMQGYLLARPARSDRLPHSAQSATPGAVPLPLPAKG